MWYVVLGISVISSVLVATVSWFMYQCIKRFASVMEMQVQALEKLGRGNTAAGIAATNGVQASAVHLQGMDKYKPLTHPDNVKKVPTEAELKVEVKLNEMEKKNKRGGVRISRVSS